MKRAKVFLMFIALFMVYHITFSRYFPVDDSNVLQAPDWYMWIGMGLSLAVTMLILKRKALFRFVAGALGRPKARVAAPPVTGYTEREADLLTDAVAVIYETRQASISMLQRKLGIGYSQGALAMDKLEQLGIVSKLDDAKPRSILVTKDRALQMLRPPIQGSSSSSHRTPINVLTSIDEMEGHQFEFWCADLLKKNGFVNVEVTPGSGDHGADILAEKDGITYAIQCKRYSSDIGNGPVQEIYTAKAIYQRHVAVVMTNQHFTRGAKEDASRTGVLLWDREKLHELMQTAGRPD